MSDQEENQFTEFNKEELLARPDVIIKQADAVHMVLRSQPADAELASPDDRQVPIEKLQLKIRTYNSLSRKGIKFASQFSSMRCSDLLSIPHFDAECLENLQEQLQAFGFARVAL